MTEPILVTKTISAQNTFSDPMEMDEGEVAAISIGCDGTWSGTIVVQRRFGGQQTWRNVQPAIGTDGFTESAEVDYEASCGQEIRVGCQTGDYSAGTASIAIRLGK